MQTLIGVQLFKPEGGYRLVWIEASHIRIWERARVKDIKRWYAKAARAYDWACAGCSAEKAVFIQLLETEALTGNEGPEEEARLTILLDLVKCFDKVRSVHLWRWGLAHGMPKKLLRLVLRTFSLTRRLMVHGSFGEPVRTVNAMLAGSVFAIAMLHAVMVYPCDALIKKFTRIKLAKYVDDISLAIQGKQKQIEHEILEAWDWLQDFSKTNWTARSRLTMAAGKGRPERYVPASGLPSGWREE